MPLNPPTAASSLEEWLRWQEQLHPQAIALGLDRVRVVAERLGLPADGIRTVMVAGTNGKGSSTALLSGIYQAAGYLTGTYSSPHLLRYNERVCINADPVNDTELCRAFSKVEAARGTTALTYFEFGTLAALHVFRESKVQVQVLEVGMGGRLDAVNIVDADGALITNIGLDHCEFLGPTRERIGYEKAGILRRDRPAVCAETDPPASIGRQAQTVGAALHQLGREYRYEPAADNWNWHGSGRDYKKLPAPGLTGSAQFRNAAGVLAVVNLLQKVLPVPESAIRSALVRLYLPGRFERRRRVILDVAHNTEASEVLAENLHAAGLSGSLHLVLGMFSDKPVEAFSRVLAPQVKIIYAAGLPGPRGLTGEALAARLQACGRPTQTFSTVVEAYRAAQSACMEGDTILVCGSFLTVAAVLGLLDE